MTPPASILNGCSHRATPDRWLYGALLTHQVSLSEAGGISLGTMCRRSYRQGSSSVPEKSGIGTLPDSNLEMAQLTPHLGVSKQTFRTIRLVMPLSCVMKLRLVW